MVSGLFSGGRTNWGSWVGGYRGVYRKSALAAQSGGDAYGAKKIGRTEIEESPLREGGRNSFF